MDLSNYGVGGNLNEVKTSHKVISPTEIKVTIEVDKASWEQALGAKLKELGGDIKVPGFREGKIPNNVVLNHVGKDYAFNQTLDDITQQAFQEYMIKIKRIGVTSPKTNFINHPNDGKDPIALIELDQEVFPEIKIPDAKSIELKVDEGAKIEKEFFDSQLQFLRERFGSLVPVKRAAKDGDFLSIDLIAKQNKKEIESKLNNSVKLEKDGMIDGMHDALIGAKEGETKKFKSTLVGGEHAGEEADIEVKVNSIKAMELPELNDDFAKLASEFETYKQFEDNLKGAAKEQVLRTQFAQAHDQIGEAVIDKLEFEIPKSLIQSKIEQFKYQMYMQRMQQHERSGDKSEMDIAELNKELQEAEPELAKQAEALSKHDIVSETLAFDYGITPSQEEIVNFLYQQAVDYGQEPQAYIEQVVDSGRLQDVIASMRGAQAWVRFLESANIKDSNGKKVDLKPKPAAPKPAGGDKSNAKAKEKK